MVTNALRSGSEFWINYENAPKGVGYGQFSVGHLILALCSALLVTLIVVFYKKADKVRRIRIRRTIAVLLVIIDILRMTFMHLLGVNLKGYLPLEVCSFAGYAVILDSIWPENKFLPELLVTIFLPGAIMQHVAPSSSRLPLLNYFSFSQFLFHGLIIAYILARFLGGEIRLTYRGVWSSVVKISVLAAAMYAVNIIIGENYMFLLGPEGNYILEKIQRVTGGGIRYTLGLIVFAVVIIHIFFVIFRVIEALFVHRRSAARKGTA